MYSSEQLAYKQNTQLLSYSWQLKSAFQEFAAELNTPVADNVEVVSALRASSTGKRHQGDTWEVYDM
jgi:hypothetical protein